jgi:hypothetical protein
MCSGVSVCLPVCVVCDLRACDCEEFLPCVGACVCGVSRVIVNAIRVGAHVFMCSALLEAEVHRLTAAVAALRDRESQQGQLIEQLVSSHNSSHLLSQSATRLDASAAASAPPTPSRLGAAVGPAGVAVVAASGASGASSPVKTGGVGGAGGPFPQTPTPTPTPASSVPQEMEVQAMRAQLSAFTEQVRVCMCCRGLVCAAARAECGAPCVHPRTMVGRAPRAARR